MPITGVCYGEKTDQTTALSTNATSINDFKTECKSKGLTFSNAYHTTTSGYSNICYALGSNETNSDTKIELINQNYGPNSPNSSNKIISNNGLSLTQCDTNNLICNLNDIIAVYTDTSEVINNPIAEKILIINDTTIDDLPSFGLFSADEN